RDLVGVVSPPPRERGTSPIVPEPPEAADRGTAAQRTLGNGDDTPQTPERIRSRRAGRKKESFSSLQEPPSSESFPVLKAVAPPSPESFWRKNRGVLVAIGCWVLAFAFV